MKKKDPIVISLEAPTVVFAIKKKIPLSHFKDNKNKTGNIYVLDVHPVHATNSGMDWVQK